MLVFIVTGRALSTWQGPALDGDGVKKLKIETKAEAKNHLMDHYQSKTAKYFQFL